MPGTRTRARGELELVVLRLLWAADEPLTAREIQDRFPGRVPASTTILTALDRLRAKGDVTRVGHEQRGIRFAGNTSACALSGPRAGPIPGQIAHRGKPGAGTASSRLPAASRSLRA